MIRKNRGVIFGTQGKSRGQQSFQVNPLRSQANMPTQFGRSASGHKPVFGGRGTGMRRR